MLPEGTTTNTKDAIMKIRPVSEAETATTKIALTDSDKIGVNAFIERTLTLTHTHADTTIKIASYTICIYLCFFHVIALLLFFVIPIGDDYYYL